MVSARVSSDSSPIRRMSRSQVRGPQRFSALRLRPRAFSISCRAASSPSGLSVVEISAAAFMYTGWSLGPPTGWDWRNCDMRRIVTPWSPASSFSADISVAARSPRLLPKPI